jgi:hypothetical protein
MKSRGLLHAALGTAPTPMLEKLNLDTMRVQVMLLTIGLAYVQDANWN